MSQGESAVTEPQVSAARSGPKLGRGRRRPPGRRMPRTRLPRRDAVTRRSVTARLGDADEVDGDGRRRDGAAGERRRPRDAGAACGDAAPGPTDLADLELEGEIAADYIEGLLDVADLDGDIDMDVEGDRAMVSVVGATLDELVGPRGEVLEALQELTRLAVHRQTGSRTRIMIDVGGYRLQRRTELAETGRDAADEVKRTGEPKKLWAMNPFERKIVHDAVAAAGLRSESEGEEPDRRVVVLPGELTPAAQAVPRRQAVAAAAPRRTCSRARPRLRRPPEARSVFGPALAGWPSGTRPAGGPGRGARPDRPRETARLWDRHLLNCAAVAELIPHPCSVIDLGSGAGLPGIVLAMLLPEAEVVLLEPMARRVAFLDECVQDPRPGQRRGLPRAGRGRWPGELSADVVTARAVAPLERLAGLALGLVRPGGLVLAIKGAGAEQELARARPVLAGWVRGTWLSCTLGAVGSVRRRQSSG